MNRPHPPTPEDTGDRLALVAGHVAGNTAASERLAAWLRPGMEQAARVALGPEDRDAEDVVTDSLLAVLDYLERRGGFEGRLESFAATVVRNRCRNLHLWRRRRPQVALDPVSEWLADTGRSALDALLEDERLGLLQEALDRLDPGCANLLRAFYLHGTSMEELRRRLGLDSVQGVYYRRARCLKNAADHLKNRLADCSTHAGSEPAEGVADGK